MKNRYALAEELGKIRYAEDVYVNGAGKETLPRHRILQHYSFIMDHTDSRYSGIKPDYEIYCVDNWFNPHMAERKRNNYYMGFTKPWSEIIQDLALVVAFNESVLRGELPEKLPDFEPYLAWPSHSCCVCCVPLWGVARVTYEGALLRNMSWSILLIQPNAWNRKIKDFVDSWNK